MISTRIHSFADYAIAAFMLFCPNIFDFDNLPPARNVFIMLGTGILLYSLITDYKASLADILPAISHGFLDVFSGLLVAGAPWLFDYRLELTQGQVMLHFAVAVALIVLPGATYYRLAVRSRRENNFHFGSHHKIQTGTH